MEEVERGGDSGVPARVGRLRARLAPADRRGQPGVGTIAWRTTSDAALERRVAAVEASGRGEGWSPVRPGTAAPSGSRDPTGTACRSTTRAPFTSPSATRSRRSRTSRSGCRRAASVCAASTTSTSGAGHRREQRVHGRDAGLPRQRAGGRRRRPPGRLLAPRDAQVVRPRLRARRPGGRRRPPAPRRVRGRRARVRHARRRRLPRRRRHDRVAPRSTPSSRRASSTRSSRAATASR